MPIESTLHSLKLLNQHKNGVSFGANTSDFTTDFVGLVGENVQVSSQVSLTWWAEANYGDEWVIGPGYIIRSSGSFFDDGFLAGQKFEFYPDWALRFTASEEFTASIDSITQGGKYLQFTVTAGTQTSGDPTPIFGQTEQGIWADLSATPGDAPDAVFFRWNVQPNQDAFSTTNSTTDEVQGWYGSGLTATPSALSPEGILQGWKSGQCTAEKEATIYDKNHTTYRFVHEFFIMPHWRDGWLQYLQGGTTPPLYQQGVSLAYRFSVEFRHALTQTTGAKYASFTNLQGVTGWFGESFGGLTSAYSVGAATYVDTATAAVVSQLQKNAKTTVAFTLSKVSGSFSAGQKVGVYISLLPPASEYQQTLTDLEENFMLDLIFHTEGTTATVGGDVLKRCEATLNAGNLDIEIDVEYSTAQRLRIDGADNYAIWVIAENAGLTAPNSDRTALIVDASAYAIDRETTGLATWNNLNFYQHEDTVGVDPAAVGPLSAWNEDGILVSFDFDLNLSREAVATGLELQLVAYNSSTGNYFLLDSYRVNLSGVIISGGVQQIEIDTTRGYNLRAGDQFNFVRVNTGSLAGSLQNYTGLFAQKIRWQDWLQNLGADPVFFDATKPQSNLNFKSSNYSSLEGYEIKVRGVIETTGLDMNGAASAGVDVGMTTDIDVYDYEVSDDTWTGEIFTIEPTTGTDLGGAILLNQDTLIRIVWNHSSLSLTNLYAIHRIQRSGAAADDIEEMSSLRLPPDVQILKPKDGETLTTLAVVGSDIHSECLIDHDELDPSADYNLSGRIERFTLSANFGVTFVGCVARITSTYGGTPTNIQYDFYLGATLVFTVASASDPYDWEAASLYFGETIRIVQTITDGGTISTEANVAMSAFSNCYVRFFSNAGAADTFDPSVVDGAAESYWRFPDNITRTGASQSVVGSAAGFDGTTRAVVYRCTDYSLLQEFDINTDKIVGAVNLGLLAGATELYIDDNPGVTSITSPVAANPSVRIDYASCGIIGTLALAPFGSSLSGLVYFFNNPLLTGLTLPTSANEIFLRGYDCNLTGVFDFSSLSNLRELLLDDNPLLTGITLAASSAVWVNIFLDNCDITGTLDLSGQSALAGKVQGTNNNNLTSISNPTSAGVITVYAFFGCNITGTWDGSGLTGLGGAFNISNNPLLTGAVFPTSSQTFNLISLSNCGITGTLVVSGLTGLAGNFNAQSNPALTGITFPASSGTITAMTLSACSLGYVDFTTLTFSAAIVFQMQNNAMTADEVNEVLVDLDATLPGAGTGSVNISGTNAAPDTTSGGFNGTAAALSLAAKGYTVTTS